MMRDDDFRPKLGKIRSRGNRQGRRYAQRVLRAIAFAGGHGRGLTEKRSRFTGSRIGRGAGVGRVLSRRDRYRGLRARRVIVKTRIMKLAGKGMNAARLHLRYLQRDGVTRDGSPGELYDATQDRADGKAFLTRGEGDRHQFRFIVAPEDAVDYEDLKGFTRRLMHQMEADLGTKLDWVAVDHYNTGHPHSHIVLRGKDDRGKDLIIARDYITDGMRQRAVEIATLDLGPRTDSEIEARLQQEVGQERFTTLDRDLIRGAGDDGRLDLRGPPVGAAARARRALQAGRLRTLQRLGLAAENAPGIWHLSPQLEPTLRRMGEREDIIKTLHRAMTRAGQERGAVDYSIHDPDDPRAEPLTGRIVERGLADELNDRHYLVVDGIDGRTHYVEVGSADPNDLLPEGAIVRVTPRRPELKPADNTIAAIAGANGGRYSVDIHLATDPSSSAEYAQTHVRRLEALRRAGMVDREPDGTWRIPADYLERAQAVEAAQVAREPVMIETLSPLPLSRLVHADAATWLDRQLTSKEPSALRDTGFGREVGDALAQRRRWLIEQGLAEVRADRVWYRRNLLAQLQRRELARAATQLSGEMGMPYAETRDGERVEGTYRRRLDLVSDRFALVEKSREFTLVPWRPVLDRHVGKSVGGIMRGDDVSWTIGRQRGRGIT